MIILWRHILRAHAIPFLFALVVLMLIFLLQFIMKFMDQLVGKGLSAGVIIEVIVLNLAWMVVLAVPMSVLVATLMAFGGLASNNEITAMRASGVSLYRMMAPALVASGVVFYLLLLFNNEVLPDANHKAATLSRDIQRKKPTLSIVPGLFSQDLTGYTILARKTFAESNDLEGVTIFDNTRHEIQSTVAARRGVVSFSPDYRKLIMDLYDGEIHEISVPDYAQYRKIRFEKHRIAMNAEGFDFQRSQESAFARGDRELSAEDMRSKVDSLRVRRAVYERRVLDRLKNELEKLLAGPRTPAPRPMVANVPTIAALSRISMLRSSLESEFYSIRDLMRKEREFRVEIHKKYAIPVACIVFILVGAPLGIMSRRGTFGVAASLSLGFFLLYWACLIGGEKLADRGLLEPWIGMWAANILLGLFGGYLTYRSARETLTINWSALRRLVPERFRSEVGEENPE
ncbi:MAG: LptF/LptG family permease [Ignavibacteriales bacterium]|nr:LptF/LptG family permease [Ignavibacteriales bacterium]